MREGDGEERIMGEEEVRKKGGRQRKEKIRKRERGGREKEKGKK